MNDNQTKDVGSDLPDQDALAAFATTALGPGRRRRRGAGAGGETKTPESAPQPDQGAASPEQEHPEGSEQPASDQLSQQPATEPESASSPAAVVPAPAPEPDPQPAAAATRPPAPREQRPTAADPAGAGQGTELQVRSYPASRNPIPPGLRGGVIEVHVADLGRAGVRATQCTIMASQSVRERFAHYQLSKKMAGQKEPSNALVVRRAFLHAKRNDLFGKLLADLYHEQTAVDEEDYDEDGLLGEVVGRRAVRGRLKDSGQQSFRPSEQELATYDAYSQAYGFPSRSDFLNAVLDEFLPHLPAGRRR